MSRFSLKVDSGMMEQVKASESFGFSRPPDAACKGNPSTSKAKFSWNEYVKVTGVDVGWPEDGENPVAVIKIQLHAPADSPFPHNIGKNHTLWYRINAEAIAGQLGEKDGQSIMTRISLSRLKGMVRASGLPFDEETYDFEPYIAPEDGSPSPLIGTTFFAKFTDVENTGDNGPARKVEPSRFVSVDDAGSL